MKSILAGVFLAVLCLVCIGEDAATNAPRSAAAVQAQAVHDGAMKKATEAYNAAAEAADKKLIEDLQAAMKTAATNGSADEVARIAEAMKNGPVGPVKTFQIHASKDWQATVNLRAGQQITISAAGQWCCNTNLRSTHTFGPRGLEGNYSWSWLEGRVGDGPPFAVGDKTRIVAMSDGVVQMRMHPGNSTPKDGFLTVTIQP